MRRQWEGTCDLVGLLSKLGFTRKPTFVKTCFQIAVFPKKPVFGFLQKNVTKK